FLLAFCRSPLAAQCIGDSKWITNPVDDSLTILLPPGTDECEFYKWSWRTFLYATYVDNASGDARPNFLKFTTMAELFPKNAPLKVPGKPPVGRVVDRIIQAKSDSFVVDQSGRALYYGIHVN